MSLKDHNLTLLTTLAAHQEEAVSDLKQVWLYLLLSKDRCQIP